MIVILNYGCLLHRPHPSSDTACQVNVRHIACNNVADNCPKLSIQQRLFLLGRVFVAVCRNTLRKIHEYVYGSYGDNELVFNVLGNHYRHRCTPPRFLAGDFPNVVGNLFFCFSTSMLLFFVLKS
jgi:hypothetical protein